MTKKELAAFDALIAASTRMLNMKNIKDAISNGAQVQSANLFSTFEVLQEAKDEARRVRFHVNID